MKTSKSNINQFINLKARMIESLKSQEVKEAWRLVVVKQTGFYELQFGK
jgi:hypothetical protein